RVGDVLQLFEIAEENRLCRTRLRARWDLARFLPVVAERAFERASVIRTAIDHAERTRDDAVAAAVADVGLHEHAAEFGADDRSGRTRFETSGVLAMFADVRRKLPRHQFGRVAAASDH